MFYSGAIRRNPAQEAFLVHIFDGNCTQILTRHPGTLIIKGSDSTRARKPEHGRLTGSTDASTV
ncbi:MAG: hypothetical protein ACU843_01900 [Gammaproteobacteria bacterium]